MVAMTVDFFQSVPSRPNWGASQGRTSKCNLKCRYCSCGYGCFRFLQSQSVWMTLVLRLPKVLFLAAVM